MTCQNLTFNDVLCILIPSFALLVADMARDEQPVWQLRIAVNRSESQLTNSLILFC